MSSTSKLLHTILAAPIAGMLILINPIAHAKANSDGHASIITSDQGGGGSKKTPRIIRDHRGDKKRERPVWRDQVILRDHRVRYGYHCPHSLARQHKCIPWNAIIHDHRARAHYGQSSARETAVTQPQWRTPSILEPAGGFSPQGAAATGSPASAGTAAPPLVIR